MKLLGHVMHSVSVEEHIDVFHYTGHFSSSEFLRKCFAARPCTGTRYVVCLDRVHIASRESLSPDTTQLSFYRNTNSHFFFPFYRLIQALMAKQFIIVSRYTVV